MLLISTAKDIIKHRLVWRVNEHQFLLQTFLIEMHSNINLASVNETDIECVCVCPGGMSSFVDQQASSQ